MKTTDRTVVGVDMAKRVFQLHWVDVETGEVVDLRLTRAKFMEHFANRAPCLVGMEACGGAQHWARQRRHRVAAVPHRRRVQRLRTVGRRRVRVGAAVEQQRGHPTAVPYSRHVQRRSRRAHCR